jgi:hypothetical protein
MNAQLTLENTGTGNQVYGTMSIEGGITLVGVSINATKVAVGSRAIFQIQSTSHIGSLTGAGIVEITDGQNVINIGPSSSFKLVVVGGESKISGMGPFLNMTAGSLMPIGTLSFDYAMMKQGIIFGNVLQVNRLILGGQQTINARLRVMNVANITGLPPLSLNIPGVLEITKQAIVYQNSPINVNLGTIQNDGIWMVSQNFDYINGIITGSGNWILSSTGAAPTFSSFSSINNTGQFTLSPGSRVIARGPISYFNNITGDSSTVIYGGGNDFRAQNMRIGAFMDSTITSTIIETANFQTYGVGCCGSRRIGNAVINSTTIVDGSFSLLFGNLKSNYFEIGNGNLISLTTSSEVGYLYFTGGTIGPSGDVGPVILTVTNTTFLLKDPNPKVINNGLIIVTDTLDCSNCAPTVPYCGFISGYSYIRPSRISGPCHTFKQ